MSLFELLAVGGISWRLRPWCCWCGMTPAGTRRRLRPASAALGRIWAAGPDRPQLTTPLDFPH